MHIRGRQILHDFAKNNLVFHQFELDSFCLNSKLFVLLAHLIATLNRLSVIPIHILQHSRRNRFHSIYYLTISDAISLKSLGIDLSDIVAVLMTCLLSITSILLVWMYLANRRRDHIRNSLLFAIRVLVLFDYITTTALLMPIVQFSVRPCLNGTMWIGIVCTVITTVTLTFKYLCVAFLTYDYRFRKQSLHFGRTRAHYTLYYFITLISTIVYCAAGLNHSHDQYILKILLVAFQAITALAVIYVHVKRYCFRIFGIFGTLILVLDSIFMVETTIGLITLFTWFTDIYPDYDLYFVIFLIFASALINRLLNLKFDSAMIQYVYEIRDVGSASLHVQLFYDSYWNQSDQHSYMTLQTTMARHLRVCNRACCFCFMSKVYYSYDTTLKQIKNHIKMTNILANRLSNTIRTGSITFFNDSELVNRMRQEQFVSMRFRSRTVEVKSNAHNAGYSSEGHNLSKSSINKELRLQSAKPNLYLISLASLDTVQKILASFLANLVDDFKKKTIEKRRNNLQSLVETTASFMIYEYQNNISAMMLMYEFIHSRFFKMKKTSLISTINILNLLSKAKDSLTQMNLRRSQAYLAAEDINLVLNYRKRVNQSQKDLLVFVQQKKDYYCRLYSHEIDVTKIIDTGSSLHIESTRLDKEISTLMDICKYNYDLLQSKYLLDLFAHESSSPSVEYIMALKETVILNRNRQASSLRSIPVSTYKKNQLEFYNEENIIVFVTYTKDTFRISNTTKNAGELFGVNVDNLLGLPLKTFMPNEISRIHDRAMLDWLNTMKSEISTVRAPLKRLGTDDLIRRYIHQRDY